MKNKRIAASAVHPVQGLSTFLRLSWLLLIPLVQRAIVRPESLWENVQTVLTSLLVLVFVLLCAGLEWRSTRFATMRSRLLFRQGILNQQQSLLPFSQVDCLYITFSLLTSVLGAGLLELETSAATRKPDCSLFLSRRKLRILVDRFVPENSCGVFHVRFWRLLIAAFSWSNAASGLLVAAPFVEKAGQVFGEEIQHLLMEQLNPSMLLISVGVPPLAAAIAWILFLGWAAAFLRQIFACAPFSCSLLGEFAVVRCGIWPRRLRLFRVRQMTAITVRQTIIMRLFRIGSLLVHVPGDERQKECRPMLIAAASQKQVSSWIENLISPAEGTTLRPPNRAIRRYLLPVFWPLLAVALLLVLLNYVRTPDFVAILLFPLLFFFIWRAFVRFAEIPFAKLQISSSTIQLCRMQGFSLLCTCVSRKNITAIRIRRSWTQKKAGLCTVDIYLRGKRSHRCSVRHLDFAQLCRAMNQNEEKK